MSSKEGKRVILGCYWLSAQNINVTYENKKGRLHANTRDINVGGVTVTFHGKPLIEDTDLVINYGNRYGFIGPNGSGKSTVMKAIAARAIPIPESLDIFFLDSEYPARYDITALEAVMESNGEVERLEKKAQKLNEAMAETDEEDQQADIQATLEAVYDRLDQLDASKAQARATTILHGLGFTNQMQHMKTKEFSGGWRMRVVCNLEVILVCCSLPVRSRRHDGNFTLTESLIYSPLARLWLEPSSLNQNFSCWTNRQIIWYAREDQLESSLHKVYLYLMQPFCFHLT